MRVANQALRPALTRQCSRFFEPVVWRPSEVATGALGVEISRSQIKLSDVMGNDPIHFPGGIRQLVQSHVQETGVEGIQQSSSMLLRHRGVSGPIVEPRHSDGVRLTVLVPLKLRNVRYQFKAVDKDNYFKENFLLPCDLAAFDGRHEVHRCPNSAV